MRRPVVLLTIVAAFVVALSMAVWIGARRQQREVSAEIDGLLRAAATDTPLAGVRELDSLPAPVARYLRWALPERSSIRVVRIQQVGTLRTDVQSDRWMESTAEQVATPAATGFVWNARVTIVPLLHVRVIDAFIEGRGSGRVTVLSAFTVSAAAGTPEMNSGSLHRLLAEAVWYPTALLPSPKLRWSPMDENTALATLTDHGVSVSLEFRFADTGEITGIYTPARWGTFGGGYQQRPWEGHFRNYQARGGIRVPTEGDVGWYFENEWHPVWRRTITSFEALPAN
jgi:hypothetical protein